jgi:hypothetical protein
VLLAFAALLIILFIASLGSHDAQPRSIIPANTGSGRAQFDAPGKAIAPKLGNETAKYVIVRRTTGDI